MYCLLELCTENVLTSWEVTPPDLKIVGDKERFAQVLHNIVANSMKFTDEGSIRGTATLEDNMVSIIVADTGVGFDDTPENITCLFTPFLRLHTDKYGGFGLGMSISNSIIKAMGGTIVVKSARNVGTTITIKIPTKPPIVERPSIVPESNMPKKELSEIQLIQQTWNLVVGEGSINAPTVGRLIYQTLFELDPTLALMFSDIKTQETALVQMIASGIMLFAEGDVATLTTVLTELGRRHAKYGITEEMFKTVGKAVIMALASALGAKFTVNVKTAWSNFYGTIQV